LQIEFIVQYAYTLVNGGNLSKPGSWTNLMKRSISSFKPNSTGLTIFLLALAKFVVQMVTGARYGIFVDEFYTLALSKHLAFGSVDVPPLTPFLTAISRTLLGESITALHVLPALAGAFTLVFVCLMAREFGGKFYAVLINGVAFLVASPWVIINSYLSYDATDQLILAAFLYVLVRFIKNGNKKTWLLLGLLAGVACMNKMTLLYLGPGFLTALLLSKYRKHLLTPWPWLGALICLIVVSPYLIWQMKHDWVTLNYWISYGTTRLVKTSLPVYLWNLALEMNLVLLPLFLIGLTRVFRHKDGVNYSFLGTMFLVSTLVMFLFHAKTWMLAAMFLPLMAAGGTALEEWLTNGLADRVLKPLLVALFLLSGVVLAPINLPVLPVDSAIEYVAKFRSIFNPTGGFVFETAALPINLSMRLGWDGMARQVAEVFDGLPPQDQKVTGIYTSWYGPASAIDYYALKFDLPNAVSGHLGYYLWGPGPTSWKVMIILMHGSNQLSPFFETCESKGAIENPYTLLFNQLNIYVCRDPYIDKDEIWKRLESLQ